MGWRPKEEDSIDAILEALSVELIGLIHFYAYGFGVAETVVAEALSEWKRMFCCHKCGVLPKQDGSPGDLFLRRAFQEVEGSLRRLGVEAVDLYQIRGHSGGESCGFLATLIRQKEGKVIHVGVCNCYLDELKLLGDSDHIANQPMYNMLERKIESGNTLVQRKPLGM